MSTRLSDPPLDHATSVFAGARPRLLAIAFRILQDPGDAEDIVQDAWLRWQRTDRSVVLDPAAFLATTTTRLALNAARCARRRHEAPVAGRFVEAVEGGAGPQVEAERRDAVEAVITLLMERLTPVERATYLLREGFDYPYRRIAELLRLQVAHTRQLARRARLGLASDRREPVDAAARRRLVEAFLAAARTGDLAVLETLLARSALRGT
ncbi:sigma factor [Jiangella mangrovi]|uniref:RNA polymerase sigma-70 factor (ECF subfamily) n=1 Tax=Jiangella mangrovi TaxID=1524084 RepID=A0A7W9GUT4_9ACTN|nr:sigma factor [Jiangella mangrovi]MBB5790357.1 RNA polymerase sigma-70 factor (ECF subfamily) [Jiangella mangrovi]